MVATWLRFVLDVSRNMAPVQTQGSQKRMDLVAQNSVSHIDRSLLTNTC